MLTCLDLSGEAGPSGSREKHTFLCPCWALPALKSLLLAFLGPQTSPHSLLARVGRGLKEKDKADASTLPPKVYARPAWACSGGGGGLSPRPSWDRPAKDTPNTEWMREAARAESA